MIRQLGTVAIVALIVGLLGGGTVCVIFYSENLAGGVVDVNGNLDLGFLAVTFVTWFAPFAAGVFALGVAGVLITAAVRRALGIRSEA